MWNRERPKFTIVGAGLGGALLAVYLGRAGYEVEVFERRPDPRSGKIERGRSINLALSVRGIFALQEVGLADAVLRGGIAMPGRMIHGLDGSLTYQPYDKDPARAIVSVSRGGLNQILVDAAEKLPGVRVHFAHRCTDVDLDEPSAVFETSEGDRVRSSGDILIGADGAFSAVRARMQRLDRFDYRQDYLAHGYKELTIPAADGGGFRMERNALHIWPRHSFMMIALPNPDGSFTCTCFWPFAGRNGFDQFRTHEHVLAYFREQFADAAPLMPTLADDFLANPTSSLVTIRCGPWNYGESVALIGDAAHAVVPFYGQGMNCAFEDCVVLNHSIRSYAPDWRAVFADYYESRKPNADALADLALANFIEMRDHSASRLFHAKKTIERTLHRMLPGWYLPLYTMVTFTRIPYSETTIRARRQNRIVLAALISTIAAVAAVLTWLFR